MWTEEDFLYTVKQLTSSNAQDRADALLLDHNRPKDSRLIPYIENLLEDRSPCCLGFQPIHTFAEIRFLAATVLQSYLHKIDQPRTLQISGTTGFIAYSELVDILEGSSLSTSLADFKKFRNLAQEGVQIFTLLQKHNLLPLVDLHRDSHETHFYRMPHPVHMPLQMYSDEKINRIISGLEETTTLSCEAEAELNFLLNSSLIDVRLIPKLELLLNDQSVVRIGYDSIYCEARYLAGKVLAWQQWAVGISTPVVIENTIDPITDEKAHQLAKQFNYSSKESRVETLIQGLRDNGRIPLHRAEFFARSSGYVHLT